MAIWIKNGTGGDKTWAGQLVAASAYYEIQSNEQISFSNNSTLLTDVGSGDAIVAKDDSGSNDITDINKAINYLKSIHTEIEVDTDGRQVSRIAFGKKGWTYFAHAVEITTSKINSVYSKDYNEVDRGDCTVRFYDSNDVELVAGTQAELDASCVKTVLTVKPDYDYEVVSGTIEQAPTPTVDIRVWVIGGIIDNSGMPWEYPTGVFNVKEFAGALNLKFFSESQNIETDGRASKYMAKTVPGVPYNANQFQFIIRHPVGHQHQFMPMLEYYKA